MEFDLKKFKQAKFKPRTEDVSVPDMAEWFTGEGKPVWTVRGLDGKEIGISKQAAAKNKSLSGIIDMLKSAKVVDKTKALEAVFDFDVKGTTDAVAERLQQMVLGSMDPVCTLDTALKVCKAYPVDFYRITNAILKLTGLGMTVGKPPGSGKKAT